MYPFLRLQTDIYRMTGGYNLLPIDNRTYNSIMMSSPQFEVPEYLKYTHLWVNPELYQKVLSAVCDMILMRSGVARTDISLNESVGRVEDVIQDSRLRDGDAFHTWYGVVRCDSNPYWFYGPAEVMYLQRAAEWWFRYVLCDLARVCRSISKFPRNDRVPSGWYGWNDTETGCFDYTTNVSEIREFANVCRLVGPHLHAREPAFFATEFALDCEEALSDDE